MENNTQNQPAQPTLFQKLMQKLTSPCHNRNSKIAKKVLALAIAAGISLGALTACNLGNTPGTTPGTTPGGSIVTPGGNDSEYSALLDGLLRDSEYQNLMISASHNKELLTSPQFDPHPYSFLEEQGHNIDAVKSGDLACETFSFVKETEPNNLYIKTQVENPGEYYTQYLLKYTLTDDEMTDYEFLHGPGGLDNGYIQSAFLNDYISKTKQETIVHTQKISIEAYDKMKNSIRKLQSAKNKLGTDNSDILMMNISDDKKYFDLLVISTEFNHKYLRSEGKCFGYKCKIPMGTVELKNNAYFGPIYQSPSGYVVDSYLNDGNVENIKIFSPQNNIDQFSQTFSK